MTFATATRAALVAAIPLLVSCTSKPAPPAPPATFSDPFAYCQSVGTIDAPDARYTGDKVPAAVAEALRPSPNAPMEWVIAGASWRCMDGKVLGCHAGANIPCSGKADTTKTPTAAMTAFCKENAGAPGIPAAVTGRETVYSWRCGGTAAEIAEQVFHADARGFISE